MAPPASQAAPVLPALPLAALAAITGVANRRDLDDRLLVLAAGDPVVVCDLDHCKTLDDRLGHAAGDRVLADFGTLLRVGLRDGDHAARYGGEELALVLTATTAAKADGRNRPRTVQDPVDVR